MKKVVLITILVMLGGCSTIKGEFDKFNIELAASVATFNLAKPLGLSPQDVSKCSSTLDKISDSLTVMLPPDFEEARKIAKKETKGNIRLVVLNVIKRIEKQVEDKEQDLEKMRPVIRAVITGAKEGLENIR